MSDQVHNEISGGLFLSEIIQGRDIRVVLPREITPAQSGLPAATPAFCGRAAELTTLLDLLRFPAAASEAGRAGGQREAGGGQARAVVSGVAGAGKTELTLQAAHAALANGWFPGGVLFAELHGDDPANRQSSDHVMAGFLRAIGVPARRIPAGRLDRALLYGKVMAAFARHGRRILVLLDAATLDQAEPLLRASAGHPVLVSTRRAFRVPDGHHLQLRALPQGDAEDAFSRLLEMADPGDNRVRDDPSGAARIAELCDGLPLAIRIAAALAAENPALPLVTMAAHLESEHTRLRELSYPGGDLRRAFDLSYQHFDPKSAELFRLLSGLPDAEFSVDTAGALAGVEAEAAERMLETLAPLVERVSSGRWQMPGLVRLYARQVGLEGGAPAFSQLARHRWR